MKLQNELNGLVAKLELVKDQIQLQVEHLKSIGKYNETRLAFDCLFSVISRNEVYSWYDKYNVTDDNIETLAKTALKQVYKV